MKVQLEEARGRYLNALCADDLENLIELAKDSDFPSSLIDECEEALQQLQEKITVVYILF